nr:FtsW/RodA/SpoVE family cell cycle protein [Nocardiopsis baichengensis]
MARRGAVAHRPRRTEAWLLAAALGLFVLGMYTAGVQTSGAPPERLALYSALFGGAVAALHMGVRFLAPYADPLMLPLATALTGVGLTTIWGLGGPDGAAHAEAWRQLMWAVIGAGTCLGTVLLLARPRRLQRYPYLLAAAGLFLLLLPMVPGLGIELYGARRWVAVSGYTVQPSEFAKLPLIVFLAAYLGQKREVLAAAERQIRVRGVKVFSVPRMRHLGPMTVAWGLAILVLVGTKDLGTSLLMYLVFLAMLYAATGRKSWVGIGLVMFGAGASAAWWLFPHVRQRVDIWLNAFDPQVYGAAVGGSYQLVEGLFSLADGGLWGTGFGSGRAGEIFAADSDLILVSIGEKLGLTGLMAVLLLLYLLVERAARTALAAREVFTKLLVTGFAMLFAFQVLVVAGGVTRLIPLTGMTTPFLAAGGSSLVSSWLVIGLWLRVSDACRRPPPDPEPGSGHEATDLIALPGGARGARRGADAEGGADDGVSPSSRATPRR